MALLGAVSVSVDHRGSAGQRNIPVWEVVNGSVNSNYTAFRSFLLSLTGLGLPSGNIRRRHAWWCQRDEHDAGHDLCIMVPTRRGIVVATFWLPQVLWSDVLSCKQEET
jgi:hypothetical protein